MSNADRPSEYVEDSHQNSSNQTAIGAIDERGTTHDVFKERAVFHAYRILCGARVHRDDRQGFWTLRSSGHWYYFNDDQMQKLKILVHRIESELVKEEGRPRPFSVEDNCVIFDRLRRAAQIEFDIPPERLRIIFIRMDQGGCGWYRIIQPVRWLVRQKDSMIHVEETNHVSYPSLCNVDMIVIPRQSSWQTLSVMNVLKRQGKLIVYETDDLLNSLPDWNPAHGHFSDEDLKQRRRLLTELADHFILSTPELKASLGFENASVVYNGIDPQYWPMQIFEHPPTQRINIMWAGSDTHSKDLSVVVKTCRKLLSEFKGKIMFTFIGYIPEEFGIYERRGQIIDRFVRHEFERDIRFMKGCPVQQWPALLASSQPDICIAPLVDVEFNRCKSELKVLEAWALGCPIVATDIEPYRRAITHGENGYLAKTDDQWHTYLRKLILDKDERFRLGGNGITALKKKYVMEELVYQMESALLKIAEGKIGRPQCNAAITARIEALEYEGRFGTGG